jgi:hypothetical protein
MSMDNTKNPTIPEGKYRVVALSAYLGEPSAKGNVPLVVEMSIIGGPQHGNSLTAYLYWTKPEVSERSVEALRALGYSGDNLSEVSFPSGDAAVEAEAVVAWEAYEGTIRAKVKWINSLGAGAKRLEDAKARDFAKTMRGAFAAFDAKHGRGQKEIPF